MIATVIYLKCECKALHQIYDVLLNHFHFRDTAIDTEKAGYVYCAGCKKNVPIKSLTPYEL